MRFKMKYLICVLLMLASVAFAEPVETPQNTAYSITIADSNATALTPDTSSWAVCKSWVRIPAWSNGVKVQFYAYDPNDPNGETFSYELYVADFGGNAQKVAAGTGTVGGSKLSHNPISMAELNSGSIDPNYAWVDTLGTITTDWMGGVTAQNDGGLNDVSSFIFDRQSARTIYCRIYGLSAYLKIYCIAYGY